MSNELKDIAKQQEYLMRVLDIVLDLQSQGTSRQESFTAATRMRTMSRRLAALCWLVKPELINYRTTEQLAAELNCDGSLIRHYVRMFSNALDIRTNQQYKCRKQ